jgi:hypothetical protein
MLVVACDGVNAAFNAELTTAPLSESVVNPAGGPTTGGSARLLPVTAFRKQLTRR